VAGTVAGAAVGERASPPIDRPVSAGASGPPWLAAAACATCSRIVGNNNSVGERRPASAAGAAASFSMAVAVAAPQAASDPRCVVSASAGEFKAEVAAVRGSAGPGANKSDGLNGNAGGDE